MPFHEQSAGAAVERGVIEKYEDGKYTVASLDRDGIKSLPIGMIGGGEPYRVGDRVYFFLFPDGSGSVICRL